jgi:hypothetical protein
VLPARVLDNELRKVGGEAGITMAPRWSSQLLNQQVTMSCANAQPSCIAKIALSNNVDRLVYGHIQNHSVSLVLLDAASLQVVKWSSPSFDFSSIATIHAGAREAMASLLGRP